ncbi:MAG: CDP-glycerol glycerophosphotransferase family protein [Alphaproteobacteria bacterium]
MKIGFIFNAQSHQIFHSLPVACALSCDYPEIEVTLLARSDGQLDYLRFLANHYDASALRYQKITPPYPYSRRPEASSVPKLMTLIWNIRTISQFDVLVVPERTSLRLRHMGLRNTKFVHTTHGAGDDERDWDTRIRDFDLVLLPGAKRRDRLLNKKLLRPGHYFVSGYSKFDLVERMGKQRSPSFSNGRKTVLYNPHHNGQHSSWHNIGHQVMEYFAQSDQFNLIFAPHVRMFDDGIITSEELTPYRDLKHVLIDTGSSRSVDMSYTLEADIYLGDWSSQVYEFLMHPRPVIFLNPRRHAWRNRDEYFWWSLGRVAENISELHAALTHGQEWQTRFEAAQKQAFNYTFANFSQSAPARAAAAIVGFIKDGRIADDLV